MSVQKIRALAARPPAGSPVRASARPLIVRVLMGLIAIAGGWLLMTSVVGSHSGLALTGDQTSLSAPAQPNNECQGQPAGNHQTYGNNSVTTASVVQGGTHNGGVSDGPPDGYNPPGGGNVMPIKCNHGQPPAGCKSMGNRGPPSYGNNNCQNSNHCQNSNYQSSCQPISVYLHCHTGYQPQGNGCVPCKPKVVSINTCPKGWHVVGGYCVRKPLKCSLGLFPQNGMCVGPTPTTVVAIKCGKNLQMKDGRCVPCRPVVHRQKPPVCGKNYKAQGQSCVPCHKQRVVVSHPYKTYTTSSVSCFKGYKWVAGGCVPCHPVVTHCPQNYQLGAYGCTPCNPHVVTYRPVRQPCNYRPVRQPCNNRPVRQPCQTSYQPVRQPCNNRNPCQPVRQPCNNQNRHGQSHRGSYVPSII